MTTTINREVLHIEGTLDSLANVLGRVREEGGIPSNALLYDAKAVVTPYGPEYRIRSVLTLTFEWPAS